MTENGVALTEHQKRRAGAATFSLGLGTGLVELVDFLIPLWAAQILGLNGVQTGVLVGADMAVAYLARHPVGRLTDRLERRTLAALGGLVFAVSFAGFALAPGFGVALAAAVAGGVAGALLRVPALSMVGEAAGADEDLFARVTGAEGVAIWLCFVGGLGALALTSYSAVFGLAALASLVIAARLFLAPRAPSRTPAEEAPAGLAHPRLMSCMCWLAGAVTAVEAATGLILMLRLIHDFGLPLGSIVSVFVPGLIVYSIFPEFGTGMAKASGRADTLAFAGVLSAVAVGALAIADTRHWLMGAWALACFSWAIAEPVRTNAVKVLAGPSALGRGMARVEAAGLAGGAVGAVVAGAAFDLMPPLAQGALGAVIMLVAATLEWFMLRGTVVDKVGDGGAEKAGT